MLIVFNLINKFYQLADKFARAFEDVYKTLKPGRFL